MDCLEQIISSRLEHGYARATLKENLRLTAAFGDWLESSGINLLDVKDVTLSEFLKSRTPSRRRGLAGVANELILKLQTEGVTSPPVHPALTPLQCVVDDFDRFLRQERALSVASRKNYGPVVWRFLSDRFGGEEVRIADLTARDVIDFVRRRIHDFSPKRAQLMLTALRVFFRFLVYRGDLETDLSTAVPSVAHWQMQTAPKGLEAEEVEQLLEHCNPVTAVGRRDHAILLLLARLGLRAGDIVHLNLDDVNWEAGEIALSGKGRKVHCLPLPADVGQALVLYLKCGRPPGCSSRRFFVRGHAPYQGFSSSVAICDVVRRGLRRAGLSPQRKGAHILRHAIATRMLRSGATLAEIGQILRHQREDTTAIYAKVDLVALKSLAREWPGGLA
jgi:site-specific recombinase XerD